MLKKALVFILSLILMLSLFACGGVTDPGTDPGGDPGTNPGGDPAPGPDENFGEKETPEFELTGYGDYEGYISAVGKFGVGGAITQFKYFIGEKGLYIYAKVEDTTLCEFSDNAETLQERVEDSDRVELYFCSAGDRAATPQSDDFTIGVTLNGEVLVSRGKGDGSTDYVASTYEPDAIVADFIDGTNTVTKRDPDSMDYLPSELDADAGYFFELFLGYERLGFEKRDTYYMSLYHVDYYDAVSGAYSAVVGNPASPARFFTMSKNGYGTRYPLEYDFTQDVEHAFWSDAQFNQTTTRAYGGTGDDMSAVAKAKFGVDGLYLIIKTSQQKLTYGGPNYGAEAFGYKNDHIELRIDANNNNTSDEDDRFFFVDIGYNRITMNGITTDTRSDGHFDYVINMTVIGEAVDGTGKPSINAGSADPKGYVFELFLPYDSLGISKDTAKTTGIGLFAAAGNPNYAGIGCVVGDETNRNDGSEDPFMAYAHYFDMFAA